ncbi:hypothetical protein Hanom_Chr08g00756481 [Helianthus anomalus]
MGLSEDDAGGGGAEFAGKSGWWGILRWVVVVTEVNGRVNKKFFNIIFCKGLFWNYEEYEGQRRKAILWSKLVHIFYF